MCPALNAKRWSRTPEFRPIIFLMDILSRTPPKADLRARYGTDASQFGDLWMPPGNKPHPVVTFFHGGWWQSAFDLAYASELCAALKAEGIAVWSVEYRRVGSIGGGWPATFQDAAAGFDYLAVLAKSYSLDLTKVVAAGHSAGGHLAFWVAGRHHIEPHSPLYEPRPRVPLHGVLALAGVVDLRMMIELSSSSTYAHDKREVYSLMGGPPAQFEDRYRAGNPGDLLPFNISQFLVQGEDDAQVPPELARRWMERAARQGDTVALRLIKDTGHFDLVDPRSRAWPSVLRAVRAMLR